LAKEYNQYIEGWINYYGQFYRTQLRSTLKRIDVYVIRLGAPEIQTVASPNQRSARLA